MNGTNVLTAKSLFSIFLTREQCAPDSNFSKRPDWQPFDTVKPIEAHGFDLTRTMIIDDSLRKILEYELDNGVVIPTLYRPDVCSLLTYIHVRSDCYDQRFGLQVGCKHQYLHGSITQAVVMHCSVAGQELVSADFSNCCSTSTSCSCQCSSYP